MIKPIYTLITILFFNLFHHTCFADDGRDFFLVQTARLGDAGDVTIISRQDYLREEDANITIFEPLISWSANNWLSLEINADSEKVSGENFNYEATVPGLRLRFTPQGQALILGMAARYEIAPENNAFKLSALAAYQSAYWLFGFNLNYEKPENHSHEWRYASAIKRELFHHFGLALEVAGNLEGNKSGEVVSGIFYEASNRFQVNVGMGTGFNNEIKLTIKTAIIWQF